MKNKPELLAPAGDLERLKIAILYGADAVYLGGPTFGLRANATNFSLDEIKEGVQFAHDRGKKVYVTVNIVMHNGDLLNLENYLRQLKECEVDAIIISDPAIIPLATELGLEIHLSTQQSTLNYEAVKFWKQCGVTRVVLGREASKSDIEAIRNQVEIELECFIHGAMCASYSGRCVLSNFLTARDANRGGCSQICRWDFDLYDQSGVHLEGDKPFTFCTKDLSMLKVLPEMIDLGIASFKIEGRMRSIYYIATIVSTYRLAIDQYYTNPDRYEYNETYEQILTNCANRESTVQFFDGTYGPDAQYYNGRIELSNQDFLGVVLDYDATTGEAMIEERNYFKRGMVVEIFGPDQEPISFELTDIYDEALERIDIVNHPLQVVRVKVPKMVPKDAMMRIKREKSHIINENENKI